MHFKFNVRAKFVYLNKKIRIRLNHFNTNILLSLKYLLNINLSNKT